MAVLYAIFWTVWALGILLVLVYGAVLLFGAPYFPTLKKSLKPALDLLELKPGQVVYDLGCGDGRFLKAAAKAGLTAIGYELNPFVAFYAWATTRRYGRRVQVHCGNFWHADITQADGVFIFLITRYMTQFDKFMLAQNFKKPLPVVSHAFKIPQRQIIKKSGAMFLYIYRPLA